jgi:hypothetical protein
MQLFLLFVLWIVFSSGTPLILHAGSDRGIEGKTGLTGSPIRGVLSGRLSMNTNRSEGFPAITPLRKSLAQST